MNMNDPYTHESKKLADVIQFIETKRLDLQSRMPATAAYQDTAEKVQKILQENDDSLHQALDQPYFGRLDYSYNDLPDSSRESLASTVDGTHSSKSRRTIYLGITFIQGKDVYSWTSPVGKLWYTQSFEDGYTAPKGYIPTIVNLKRYLKIRNGRLETINDIFHRHDPTSETAREDILKQAVSGVGTDDGHLQVIVETIEPDQYEKIANVTDRVLIVQGSAGSGKSEIGLHRIAFLLSPFNDITEFERPTPSTTLFVGPSQAFLEYAADILPNLGVQEQVEQIRFSKWIIDLLSSRTAINLRIWPNLLDKGKITRFHEEAEAFKGSLAMADILDRYVAEIVDVVRRRSTRLFRNIPVHARSSRFAQDQVISLLNDALNAIRRRQPLNRQRQNLIDRVARLARHSDRDGRRPTRKELERRQAEVRNQVSEWCDREWKHFDFKDAYIALLSEPARIVRLARGKLTEDVAAELRRSAYRIQRQGFDDSDLGPLAYMDHLLNDTIARRYRHIVIDEAQDISPIEFKLLSAASTNNWFTILGDTAQRLTPYRGVRRWRELERVFGRSEIGVQLARRSYRSTRQVTDFNNRILRTFDKNIKAPIAFEREGNRVEYCRYKNTASMYLGIIEDVERIRSLNGLEDSVIAVLARDQLNLNRFRRFWLDYGLDSIDSVNQEFHNASRTVLARIPDVKGLEYDGVIVMGVNESFADTTFNKKLLYLATTRAKHYLGIHWSGKQSPILSSISNRGITQHSR